MRFFLNETIHPLAVRRLRERGEIVENFEKIEEIDAIILRATSITSELMQRAKRLKVIGKHGIGYDNIDIEMAKKLGIRVVYTPLANVDSVAELIVSYILCLSRNIVSANKGVQESRFNVISPSELTGIEVRGKTLGLVGMGNIALAAADILRKGLNVNVIGHDPYIPEEKALKLGIRKYEILEEMLSEADYVSISVPLTDLTRNLISEKQLQCMKPSAILVNSSRGGIVNEAALYKALKEGKLRAAGSDVFVQEPPTGNNPLTVLKNFIATPHIGANTEEALYRMGMTVVDEVLAVLEGKQPNYPVV